MITKEDVQAIVDLMEYRLPNYTISGRLSDERDKVMITAKKSENSKAFHMYIHEDDMGDDTIQVIVWGLIDAVLRAKL